VEESEDAPSLRNAAPPSAASLLRGGIA